MVRRLFPLFIFPVYPAFSPLENFRIFSTALRLSTNNPSAMNCDNSA